jgi:hypothetical protein
MQRTVDVKGNKAIRVKTTKHEKDRISIVLCITASGIKLSPLLIFKSRTSKFIKDPITTIHKSVYNVNYNNKPTPCVVHETVSSTGFLNESIMLSWIQEVYKPFVSLWPGNVFHLVIDNMAAHKTENVIRKINECSTKLHHFPPNCTPILQPLDHSINAVFKREYKIYYTNWFEQPGQHVFTRHGNLKIASKDEIKKWVANSWNSISSESIVKSWTHVLNVNNK